MAQLQQTLMLAGGGVKPNEVLQKQVIRNKLEIGELREKEVQIRQLKQVLD